MESWSGGDGVEVFGTDVENGGSTELKDEMREK
jgi:hypothetical protein